MIAWIIETVIATTLLMLLVLAIRKPVGRTFGPNIAYALWVLPVFRMAMPPMPGSWSFTGWLASLTHSAEAGSGVTFGILNADTAPQAIIDQALIQAQVELAGRQADLALVPPTVTESGPNVATLLIGVWVIGAMVFLGYHLLAHRRFCAGLLRKAEVRRTVAEGRVHVIETDAATGPLAFGIWRKYVAFPRDFNERYDPLERNLALAHELGHHLRGDLIANWIALVVLALHWFNPVAWRAFRAFRADQEMACDALVLSGRAPALRHAYGRAIVKSAHGGAVSAACHLHTINELKGRLRMLSKHNPKSRTRITAGVTGALALSLGALALTASGSGAAAERGDAPRPPAAPIAPAAPAALAPVAAVAAPPAPQSADAPPAPEAPETPPAPDAPEVSTRGEYRYVVVEKKDGKETKRETRVVRMGDKDAKFAWSGTADADVDVDIRSAKCGGSKDDEVKIETREGGKRKIVLCTDRIEMRAAAAGASARGAEAQARRAQAIALASADMGKRHAMMSLKMARRSIEMQKELGESQKSAALRGIDEAIRELETDEQD